MNLFELFVKIGVKDEASKNVSSISQKLGNGLKTAAKIGTAAVTAASTAIVMLTKNAVESYAEYEQLVGGVQTLFNQTELSLEEYAETVGKTADQAFNEWSKLTTGARLVQNNADKAFKSAGLSANEYMSTVTSFSASLIASLEGDTVAAAKAADRAVVDMADNANKMGTSMELIQNAYQGFAKQNYTMLDNLKLGYGGTKEEMSRLISDASKMTDVQKKLNLTVKEGDTSFGNIVNAISVMQSKMGIAGATANEAATTISGSLGMLKASWQNVLTALSDDNASGDNMLFGYIEDLAESAGIAIENLLPAVEQALVGVSSLIDQVFPEIMNRVPSIIEETLPKVTISVVKIVESLVNGISQNQEMLVTTAFSVIMTLVNGFLSLLPKVLQLGLNLIVTLATGIAENIDTLLPSIVETVTGMYEMFTDPEQLSKMLKAALDLIVKLAYGIIEAIPELIDSAFQVIDNLVTFLTDPSNLAMLVSTALELIVALAGGLIAAIPKLVSAAITLVTNLSNTFKNRDWGQVGRNIIDKILSGLKNAWANVKSWFTNAWNSLFGNRSVSVSANVRSSGVNGSHAGGLDYVPFDGYIAELHKGEQVLTASEAKAYRQGGGSVNVVQNIYSQAKTAADLMQEAKYQQERAVLLGV